MFGSFLQLRFQSAEASPFDTHRLHILAFFTVIVIYAVSLGIEIQLEDDGSNCLAVVRTISLLTGSLALILLLLIIEPYVGWPLLIVWFLYFVKLACESYNEIPGSIVSEVKRAADFLKSQFKRAADSLKSQFNPNSNQNGDANQSV